MKLFEAYCLAGCLVVVVCAVSPYGANQQQRPQPWHSEQNEHQQQSYSQRPSDWLSPYELENLPALNEITWPRLENMPAKDGAEMFRKIYHVYEVSEDMSPSYVPNPSQVPASIIGSNGQSVEVNLNNLVSSVKQLENFGDEGVTIFITGYPQQTASVRKANRQLVQAYMERFNAQRQRSNQQGQQGQQNYDNSNEASNENNEGSQSNYSGNLIVIDLGSTLTNLQRFASIDIERTGAMIARLIVQMTNEADVPQETIHIVAQGIAAHVAGVAGREHYLMTGHKLRRITGLSPTRIFAKTSDTLTALARGDADFVDAIHTSPYGMGVPARVADADFYPNGPSVAMPGSNNIVEADMRATRYFAESVRPGNEHNFPAATAVSMQQYRNIDGYERRAHMGIAAEYDTKGAYVLQVNAHSPFGRASTPARHNHRSHEAASQSAFDDA